MLETKVPISLEKMKKNCKASDGSAISYFHSAGKYNIAVYNKEVSLEESYKRVDV